MRGEAKDKIESTKMGKWVASAKDCPCLQWAQHDAKELNRTLADLEISILRDSGCCVRVHFTVSIVWSDLIGDNKEERRQSLPGIKTSDH